MKEVISDTGWLFNRGFKGGLECVLRGMQRGRSDAGMLHLLANPI